MTISAMARAMILVAPLSACAGLGQLKGGDRVEISYKGSNEKIDQAGAVYVWPPYSSAAIVDREGNRCVLAASGAKTINATTEAALKLGKALDKIEGLDASVKSTLLESFTKTSAADSKAAFVDIALFHLCLLDQNGTFKKDDGKRDLVMQAYYHTIDAITKGEEDITPPPAPPAPPKATQ
jgi:hypothetical protein